MRDALLLLLRLNLAAAAAVAVVMLLRAPTRRLFGAGAAYALWILTPLALLAMVLPGRVITLTQPRAAPGAGVAVLSENLAATGPPLLAGLDAPAILAGLWLLGGLTGLAYLAGQQLRFARAVRAGRGGPAVIGILRPRIVTPCDFAQRYTAREQMVVLAHERTHIARHDSRINAAVALARCALWFNPLVHLLAHYLRIDQELACDAAVVAQHPTSRRAYAEALLKTQLAGRPLPLGCYWPAQAAHPLAQRIGLLSAAAPPPTARRLGGAIVAALALAGAGTAWVARPAQIVIVPAPVALKATAVRFADRATPFAPPSSTRQDARPVTLAAATGQASALTPIPVATAPAAPSATAIDALPPNTPLPNDPPKLMPVGLFGPPRVVHGLADWSRVEPGSAVRVIATMTDPDGVPLTTDLTAFGSQSRYRLGYIRRGPSRYKLFTKVEQHGDRLIVTAGLDQSFESLISGSVELGSGETGTIRLPGGELITVTPILRPETPQELAAAQGRALIQVERVETL